MVDFPLYRRVRGRANLPCLQLMKSRNLVSLAATWQIGRFGDDFAAKHQTLGPQRMRTWWGRCGSQNLMHWCPTDVPAFDLWLPILSGSSSVKSPAVDTATTSPVWCTLKSDRVQNGTLPYWGFLKWGISNQWMVYTGKTVNMDDLVWIKPGVNLHFDATLCHILMKGKP